MTRPLTAFVCAAGLGAASAGLASLALFDLTIGLILLGAAGWAVVVLTARWVNVERTIVASEVQEDFSLRLCFAVRIAAWLPVRIEIEDHSGGWLEAKAGEASVELRVGRPGAYRLAPTRIRLRDPLGIFERRLLAGCTEPLLILPRPLSPWNLQLHNSGMTGDPELQGLQPYAPGSSLARIHWPALARGAGLHVRQFAPPPNGLPLVVVDTAGAVSRVARDWAARTAAGCVLALSRTGGCRILLPGDTDATSVVGTDAWRAVHRRLATLADLPSPVAPSRAPDSDAFCVRVALAPAKLAAPPPLPHGVLRASECALRR
jgi:uncharacterized protein (DUF58 family)